MKTKRVWVFIIIFVVLAAAVLAVPIPKAALDDGGICGDDIPHC